MDSESRLAMSRKVRTFSTTKPGPIPINKVPSTRMENQDKHHLIYATPLCASATSTQQTLDPANQHPSPRAMVEPRSSNGRATVEQTRRPTRRSTRRGTRSPAIEPTRKPAIEPIDHVNVKRMHKSPSMNLADQQSSRRDSEQASPRVSPRSKPTLQPSKQSSIQPLNQPKILTNTPALESMIEPLGRPFRRPLQVAKIPTHLLESRGFL